MKVLFDRMNGAVKPLAEHLPIDKAEAARVKGLFAESLLSCDRIVIPISGVGLEVPTLLRWMKLPDLEKFIQERVIEFTFVPGSITYLTVENKKALQMKAGPGLEYFVNRGTKEEPLDSTSIYDNVEYALKKQTTLSRTDRRRLTRLVSDRNINVDSKEAFDKSLRQSRLDAIGPIGTKLGLNDDSHPDEGRLSEFARLQYIKLAHGNLSVFISSATDCNEIICDSITSDVLDARLQATTNVMKSNVSALKAILDYEGIPNIEQLLLQKKMKMSDIFEIRDSEAGSRFRNFLAELDDGSAPETIRGYVEACANDMFPNTALTKTTRLVIYAGITIALAHVDPLAGIAAGISKDAFDIFLFEKLKKGWSPRELPSSIERRF